MHCNFTSVSVLLPAILTKTLGAHQELAEHCLRRHVGAQRGQGISSPETQAQCAPTCGLVAPFHSHLLVSLSWIRVKRESFKKS